MFNESDIVLSAKHIVKQFPASGGRTLTACNDVNLNVYKGKTLGIVGESGCGKSTFVRMVISLDKPTSGEILYHGKNLSDLSKKETWLNRQNMQMVFQDPLASFDPKMKIVDILTEPLINYGKLKRSEKESKARELLKMVELPEDFTDRYPHNMSGGQRQRIGIARALSVNPEFLLCDVPISALDVSIQAQVVNVLEDLQQELGLTYLFVAHDLSMVRHISDRIGVMYLGKIVESGESDEEYDNPCHPYTRALLAYIPIADPKRALSLEHCGIEGDLPSPLHVPSGCRFHTRCPYATDQCRQQEPELEERTPGHMVACWKK